jgi:hypothetical protein
VTPVIYRAFLPRGSVLTVITPNCSQCSLRKATRPERLPDEVRADPGVPPSTLIYSSFPVGVCKSSVGTSHSPTHNPYSFGRCGNLPQSNVQSLLFRSTIDQLKLLPLLPDNPYSRNHSQSQSPVTTDSQSVGLSWCRASSGAHDQKLPCQ